MACASLVMQVEAGPRVAGLCGDGEARVGCCRRLMLAAGPAEL